MRVWHLYLYLGIECGSPGFCWLFPPKDDVIYCHLLYKASLRAVCKMCWLLHGPCRACECLQRQFVCQQPELRTPVSQNRQTLLHLSFFVVVVVCFQPYLAFLGFQRDPKNKLTLCEILKRVKMSQCDRPLHNSFLMLYNPGGVCSFGWDTKPVTFLLFVAVKEFKTAGKTAECTLAHTPELRNLKGMRGFPLAAGLGGLTRAKCRVRFVGWLGHWCWAGSPSAIF